MKARIKWVEGRTFVGESGSGHKLVLGTAFGAEGQTPGPSPMELVLIGTGGCSAFDVVHILEKGREAIEDCVVELEAERAEKDPKVFTRIHMHFVGAARHRSLGREILLGVGNARQDGDDHPRFRDRRYSLLGPVQFVH
jgi:putative redox protein